MAASRTPRTATADEVRTLTAAGYRPVRVSDAGGWWVWSDHDPVTTTEALEFARVVLEQWGSLR